MKPLRTRIEQLENQTDTAAMILLVHGEPTPEQQAAIDSGRVKVALYLPDNGRDPRGTHERTN